MDSGGGDSKPNTPKKMRQEMRLRTMELSDKWQKKWNEHTVECHLLSPSLPLWRDDFPFRQSSEMHKGDREKKSQIVPLTERVLSGF